MPFRYWPHPVPDEWVLQGLVPVDTADNQLSSSGEVKYARMKHLSTSESSYALAEYMWETVTWQVLAKNGCHKK
jgi:hypothetical protein